MAQLVRVLVWKVRIVTHRLAPVSNTYHRARRCNASQYIGTYRHIQAHTGTYRHHGWRFIIVYDRIVTVANVLIVNVCIKEWNRTRKKVIRFKTQFWVQVMRIDLYELENFLQTTTSLEPTYWDCNIAFDDILVDCVWFVWSSWSECSVTCGTGEERRQRDQEAEIMGGLECEGPAEEVQECHPLYCPGKTSQ